MAQPERTLTVEVEDRTEQVAAESRTQTVVAESRTLTVPGPYTRAPGQFSESAYLRVHPVLAAGVTLGYQSAAALSAAPVLAATTTLKHQASAILTSAPTVAATSTLLHPSGVSLSVTPSVAASAALEILSPPAFAAQTSNYTLYAPGNIGSTYGPLDVSATHTASGGVVVAVSVTGNTGADVMESNLTPTVTYGGTPMTLLGHRLQTKLPEWSYTLLYGLLSPPSGAQTVEAQVATTFTGQGVIFLTCASYTQLTGFGTEADAGGIGSPTAVTIASSTTDTCVCAIGGGALYGGSLTGFTQTERAYQHDTPGYGGMVMGEAAGASSVTFSGSVSAYSWAAVAVNLL